MWLWAANMAARVGVLVIVGLFTFFSRWPGAGQGAAQIAVFAVGAIVLLGTGLAGRDAAQRRRLRVLPWAYALVIVSGSAVIVTRSGGNLLALAVVAAMSAGSDLDPVSGWAMTIAGAVSFELADLVSGFSLVPALEVPFLLGVGFLLGANRRYHRVQAEQAAALLAKSEALRDQDAMVATLDERTRIAREIHDVLAHSLGALGLHIQLARAVLTDQNDTGRVVELLDQAHRMATDGLAETRRAVHALRGDTLPLPEGLAELSADHQRRHGAPVSFAVTGEPRPLPPDARLAIARTAQEALVNTAKHAPSQPVEVRLDYSGPGTSLRVSNHVDGAGHAAAPFATADSGYGLAGLRERLLLLKGSLTAGRRGGDWVVEARVPQ
ncbi:MAG TPA: histidine kinase [Streptosporangiaceae bacterium]|jgi:signal transduction histidine kinase